MVTKSEYQFDATDDGYVITTPEGWSGLCKDAEIAEVIGNLFKDDIDAHVDESMTGCFKLEIKLTETESRLFK